MTPLPKVSVASDVLDKIGKLEDGVKGSIYGHLYNGTLVVLGLCIPQENHQNNISDFLNCTPSEIQICGAFTSGLNIEETVAYCEHLASTLQIVGVPFLLTSEKNSVLCHSLLKGMATKVNYTTVSSAQLASTFVYFRTKAEFLITSQLTLKGFQQSLDELKKKISEENVAFLLSEENVLVAGAKSESISGMSEMTADSTVKALITSDPECGKRNFDILSVQMLAKQSKEHEQCTAPSIRHVRCNFENARMVIKVDSLSLLHRNAKIALLYTVLGNSVLRGLSLVESCLLQQLKTGNQKTPSSPEIFHFCPAQSSHLISVVYPKGSLDADLKKQRELLHKTLGFALDQPMFRRSQAYNFSYDESPSGPLVNPHEGLNSGLKGGQPSLVKGLYSYYHYMQDRFDDNGWGCAYRSLQTVVSWFRLQGYTEVSVPSHKQIQECLVKIGDKPASFIGSRQWIGSTEVSFVLETMLGVQCKILTASTGEEVGSLGSELSYHFETHGTPVMIGGGVLAHTIIGVDYNRNTGEIKFLILDPHYTGGEDIGVITKKGWVGWKDTKFWTKNAFYNLCLPLRPIGDV